MRTDSGGYVSGTTLTGDGGAAAREPALSIRDLSVVYRTVNGDVRAVADVTLDLHAGEVLGLVGESGSGKSTLAYGATRLLRAPALITGGSVIYRGRRMSGPVDILGLTPDQLASLRWREIAIVFQSAMNALNPVLSVSDQLTDVIRRHLRTPRPEAVQRAGKLLDLVGIPRSRLRSFPHELSGGMRQRVMIAMALATDPEVVIMDEPTTALDVVVQREILGQIMELRETLGFSILFITHDLSLLLEIADRVAVMYGGQMMEVGSAEQIHHEPSHPYTKRLLRAFPSLHGPRKRLAGIPGTPPDLLSPPPGCPFLERCLDGTEKCKEIEVRLLPVRTSADPRHQTACPFVLPDQPDDEGGTPGDGARPAAAVPTVDLSSAGLSSAGLSSTGLSSGGVSPDGGSPDGPAAESVAVVQPGSEERAQ